MAAKPNKTQSNGERPSLAQLFRGLLGRSDAKPQPPAGAKDRPAENPADDERPARPGISQQPSRGGAPKPPETPQEPLSSPDQRVDQELIDGLKEFESVVLGSRDPVAAIKDYAGHATGRYHDFLMPLLETSGALTACDLGHVAVIKLTRTGRWWIRAREEQAPGQYDAMVALETALNVSCDLLANLVAGGVESDCSMAKDVIGRLVGTASLEPSGYKAPQNVEGEWASRLNLARYLEDTPAPTRILADFQMDVEGHVAVIDVEVMRPAALGILGIDGQKDVLHEARAYAYRLCLLAGKAAFTCAEGLTRVVVNGREAQTDYPLLSLDLARAGMDALLEEAADEQAYLPPRRLGVRFQDNATGWFEPVTPFAQRGDQIVNPPERWDAPEMSSDPCPPAVREACHAKTWRDLGINEKAVRVAAWNKMAPNLGITTRQSVAQFVETREKTRDVTVASACERASESLVNGTVDAADKHSLAHLFVDGSDLAQVVEATGAVEEAAASDEDHVTYEEVDAAVASLREALDPLMSTGTYLDDSDNVYRYFNSMAERMRYNQLNANELRRVCLVPDEYYAANTRTSRMLCALERPHEALPFAEEAVRLAPVCCDAALTKVRCLEEASRLYEACEVLVGAIRTAVSTNDLAICFYRLAFMQWRLNRPKVAAACYLRAIAINRDLGTRIKVELGELMASAGKDCVPQEEDEVRKILTSANIPFGNTEKIRADALLAAQACVDAKAFAVAQPLVGVAVQAHHDDALMRVYRSLAAPIPEG